jgi:hypothetical protein
MFISVSLSNTCCNQQQFYIDSHSPGFAPGRENVSVEGRLQVQTSFTLVVSRLSAEHWPQVSVLRLGKGASKHNKSQISKKARVSFLAGIDFSKSIGLQPVVLCKLKLN